MIMRGKIQNGVVVLEPGAVAPEGADVSVFVVAAGEQFTPPPKPADIMSPEEKTRVLAILDAIAAMPIEGDAEPFSGADHDKVLYGKP